MAQSGQTNPAAEWSLSGRSDIVPHWIMRVPIVLVGAALTVAFAWRYWF
jgi:hypothetical protein